MSPQNDEMAPGTTHASLQGYPACGAEQRPMDVRGRFLGDVVSGTTADVDCPECMALPPCCLPAADVPDGWGDMVILHKEP